MNITKTKNKNNSYINAFSWSVHGDGKHVGAGQVVLPHQRLSWPRTIGFGIQHVVAMFGATVLVPTITGFPVATTLLFSGIGTLVFLIMTKGIVPSYLGSSFSFVAPLAAVKAQNLGFGVQLGCVVATGLALFLIGCIVQFFGTGWIERLMPTVVTGTIIALIGLNLAGVAKPKVEQAPLTAFVTIGVILVSMVFFKGLISRFSILIGIIIGYIVSFVQGEVKPEALENLRNASWMGVAPFHAPEFNFSVLFLFFPVLLVMVVENIGHLKSVASITGVNNNSMSGRAIMADGIATSLAGGAGGSGTTTYAENIGVMSATRVFSTAAYFVAAITAILLSFCPKVAAAIGTIPEGVLGGAGVVLYGMIGILGIKVLIEGKVNLNNSINFATVAVPLIIAIGNISLIIFGLEIDGMSLGSVAALIIFHGLKAIAKLRHNQEALDNIDSTIKPL